MTPLDSLTKEELFAHADRVAGRVRNLAAATALVVGAVGAVLVWAFRTSTSDIREKISDHDRAIDGLIGLYREQRLADSVTSRRTLRLLELQGAVLVAPEGSPERDRAQRRLRSQYTLTGDNGDGGSGDWRSSHER